LGKFATTFYPKSIHSQYPNENGDLNQRFKFFNKQPDERQTVVVVPELEEADYVCIMAWMQCWCQISRRLNVREIMMRRQRLYNVRGREVHGEELDEAGAIIVGGERERAREGQLTGMSKNLGKNLHGPRGRGIYSAKNIYSGSS
jgi:hypothetical protein